MNREGPMEREARAHPLIEGEFFVYRPSAESLKRGGWPADTLVLFKGDDVIGLIAPHLCGETCFFADARTPALRSETLDLIARVIDLYPTALRQLADAPPKCSTVIEYRPAVVAKVHFIKPDKNSEPKTGDAA